VHCHHGAANTPRITVQVVFAECPPSDGEEHCSRTQHSPSGLRGQIHDAQSLECRKTWWACFWSHCGSASPSLVLGILGSSIEKTVVQSRDHTHRPNSHPQWWPSTWRMGHPWHADEALDKLQHGAVSVRRSEAWVRTLQQCGACSNHTWELSALFRMTH